MSNIDTSLSQFAPTRHAPKEGVIEFDWEELARLLGERPEVKESDLEVAAVALGVLIRWVVSAQTHHSLDTLGRRVVALAWVVDPSIFDGDSAAAVGRRFGVCRQMISCEAAAFSRTFGLRNRAQRSHGATFKAGVPGAALLEPGKAAE